ncbi:MAG: M24 family metallopeptidase, partial [Acidobacteriaceae bacterium]|nr:M24 family metallopeptidase [Acidobacteriaceae bacterium]
MNLDQIQSAIRDQKMDGWLFYDHHHRDPIAYRILGLDEHTFVSRRWFYYIPATGEPRKLVHRIESLKLDALPGAKRAYSSWQELEAELSAMLASATKIAMQYSPRNAIMYVAMVDAGTIELLREMRKEIVSSANLISIFEAVLTEAQIATHYEAQRRLDRVLAAGFKHIGDEVRAGRSPSEFDIVSFLNEGIVREGLWTDHGPNCSAGPNSADSHYEPTAEASRAIRTGDFILIDIWAKLANNPTAIWYDITWTGVVGREPSEREKLIFDTVREARDVAIARVQRAFAANEPIAGWQADDAAREVIGAAGFGEYFTHRTGHNIAVELHGNGAHLDNLETHDERLILPYTCFSVEPGIYFPGEFG